VEGIIGGPLREGGPLMKRKQVGKAHGEMTLKLRQETLMPWERIEKKGEKGKGQKTRIKTGRNRNPHTVSKKG